MSTNVSICEECLSPLPGVCVTPLCDECLSKRCPMPDCESSAQRFIGRRPDGVSRYECEECGTEWSIGQAVAHA